MSKLKGENRLSAIYGAAVILFICSFFSSCYSVKNVSYFKDIRDSLHKEPMEVALSTYTDPKIQPKDLLQISVQTIDPQATTMMGAQQTATYSTQGTQGGGSMVPGYLVDQNGEIELPLVGRIKVGGLTTSEARNLIAQKASQYYKNPVVNVRFANFVITVLGDVSRPGQYTVPGEKISVLDALGMAGDLTVFGKRDDVNIIREENGKKTFAKLDLNSKSMFQSDYFYLKQHDVVYVGPTKNKAASADVTTARTLGFISTGMAILNLIVILAFRI